MITKKNQTIQVTLTIGLDDYEDLQTWAYSHGRTPAEYAAQIIAARIEANLGVIELLKKRYEDRRCEEENMD